MAPGGEVYGSQGKGPAEITHANTFGTLEWHLFIALVHFYFQVAYCPVLSIVLFVHLELFSKFGTQLTEL